MHRNALARTLTLALIVMGFALVAQSSSALAAAPPSVSSQITDTSGVLDAGRATVSEALEQFTDTTGFQLYVVYVKSFGDLTGNEFAQATAARSQLGTTDILLAVATDDSAFGVAEPRKHVMSHAAFLAVSARVKVAVDGAEWASAAVIAARGYQEASSDSDLPWAWILIAVVAVFLAGAVTIRRVRRRYDQSHVIRDEHGQPIDPLQLLDTDELVDNAKHRVAALSDGELKSQLVVRLDGLTGRQHGTVDDARRADAIDILRRAGAAAP